MFRYFIHISTFFKLENFGRLTLMLLGFIVVGTFVYHYTEGWSWMDSYYFAVMTLSTVGYGDFNPKTTFSKIFTILYVLGGLGILLNFVTVFYEYREMGMKRVSKKVTDAEKEIKEDISDKHKP